MCQTRGSQSRLGAWGYDYGCCECGCSMLFRRFISKKEKQERLEEYRDQLKKEIEGIEERIKELKVK